MLPPNQSPIHQLASLWRGSRLPGPCEISACRARLFTAATHEITAKAKAGIQYDPLRDHRFIWCAQWLAVADGDIKAIDPNTEFLATLTLQEAPILTNKHIAASDIS